MHCLFSENYPTIVTSSEEARILQWAFNSWQGFLRKLRKNVPAARWRRAVGHNGRHATVAGAASPRTGAHGTLAAFMGIPLIKNNMETQ